MITIKLDFRINRTIVIFRIDSQLIENQAKLCDTILPQNKIKKSLSSVLKVVRVTKINNDVNIVLECNLVTFNEIIRRDLLYIGGGCYIYTKDSLHVDKLALTHYGQDNIFEVHMWINLSCK